MFRLHALVAIMALTISGCVAADGLYAAQQPAPEWRLVYAHDNTGASLEGSKQALIDAVRDGKPVRVVTTGRRVEHAMDAQFLTIFEGEVFAQVEPIEAQQPASDPPRILFRQPGQKWRSIMGTNGFVVALMDGREPNQRNGAARWFVQH